MLFESVYSQFKNELTEDDKELLYEIYIVEEFVSLAEKYLANKYLINEDAYEQYIDAGIDDSAQSIANEINGDGQLDDPKQQKKLLKKLKEKMKKLSKINKLKKKLMEAEAKKSRRKVKKYRKQLERANS